MCEVREASEADRRGGLEMRPYEENPMGHEWAQMYEEADIFGFSEGTCNGPRCVKCGYYFCHHCQKMPSEECSEKTFLTVTEKAAEYDRLMARP